MTVLALARSSLRWRAPAFAASALALFLAGAITMAFASLLDTASHPAVTDADRETLLTMATVVGFWGLIIGVFAVASTLTLAIRQRDREIALLKSIGATPAQVTRLVVGEALAVAVVAWAAAVPLGYAGGAVLARLLQDTGRLSDGVGHRFAGFALGVGAAVVVCSALGAAVIASRRAARLHAREALAAAALPPAGLSRTRRVAGLVFLGLGLGCGVVTATVFDGKGIDAMQTAGQASIWASIGCALLAPALVRSVVRVADGPLGRLGAAGWLAAERLRANAHAAGGVLGPIILFVGIATGALSMQVIEDRAPASAAATMTETDVRSVETLNLVVVGMIALFAAITVVNSLVAATAYRRREFAQQRLAGATPRQVRTAVGLEAGLLAGTGVAIGAVASLVTIVPFALARVDELVPAEPVVVFPLIAAATLALVPLTALATARRSLAVPAVIAVRPATGAR